MIRRPAPAGEPCGRATPSAPSAETHPPTYRERAAPPALAPWVEAFWTVRGWVAPGCEVVRSVLPDGCMDVIFDLAPDVGLTRGERHFVVGTMTRPLAVPTSGAVHLAGMRFRPGAAPAFLDLAAHEVVDARAPLDALWGADARKAWERLAAGEEGVVEQLLLPRLRAAATREDALVRRAAELLDAGVPPAAADLSRGVGVGRRQLERRFRDSVGVSPGTLSRILRFRRAAAQIGRGGASLARIALERGYHDQPHMNRDFRVFAGRSPGAFRASGSLAAPAGPALPPPPAESGPRRAPRIPAHLPP